MLKLARSHFFAYIQPKPTYSDLAKREYRGVLRSDIALLHLTPNITIVKAANELLWLSLTRDQIFREQLVAETKTLIAAYLQTYQI